MNGVIYTRVSSDEQVEGMSLDFQQRDCTQYAAEHSISIRRVFEERGESAKFANRPELLNLLNFCKENRRSIDVVIVWKLDRLSRNQMDYYFIKRKLHEWNISLLSATEPSLDNRDSIASRVFETFSALQAEIDNISRRERAVRGMAAKIEVGIYPWKPPLGYLCAQNRKNGQKKTEPDEPDSERFPIIKRLFRTCLEDRIHSVTELTRLANSWGLRTNSGKKVYAQFIEFMISNPFYAGVLTNPWTQEEFTGQHIPAVSHDNFLKIQSIRNGRSPQRSVVHSAEHPDFPLRKTVKCGACDTALTGSWSRGNGGRYAYYHCARRGCDWYGKTIPKKKLEDMFCTLLGHLEQMPFVRDLFFATLEGAAKEDARFRADHTKQERKKKANFEKQLDSLINMRQRGLLTDDEFLDRKDALRTQIAEATIDMTSQILTTQNISTLLSYAKLFLENLPQRWRDIDLSEKLRFQQFIFPNGISYTRNEGFGTTEPALIFKLLGGFDPSNSNRVHRIGENWNLLTKELEEINELMK